MYLRVIKGQTQPGQVDELARRWAESVGSRLRGMPGLRNAYFAGDRTANTVLSVSVWDSKPDEAALDQRAQEFVAQVRDIVSGAPTIEGYQILEQV